MTVGRAAPPTPSGKWAASFRSYDGAHVGELTRSDRCIQTKQDLQALIASEEPVIVKYTASWCPPCQAIAPVFEILAHENPTIHMVEVDVDSNRESAEAANVQSVPTFELYLRGVLTYKFSSADKKKLLKMVAQAKA